MKITKRLLYDIADVDILGGDECVIVTYKDGSKEIIDASTGAEAKTDYKINPMVVERLNKSKRSMFPFNPITTCIGASYFGHDGLVHINMGPEYNPPAAVSVRHESPRGVVVNNPVVYAMTLASILGSSTMEEAALNISTDVFESYSDFSDVKEAFATFVFEVTDLMAAENVTDNVENLIKILNSKRIDAKVGVMRDENYKKRLEKLFKNDDPILL